MRRSLPWYWSCAAVVPGATGRGCSKARASRLPTLWMGNPVIPFQYNVLRVYSTVTKQ